MFDKTTSLIKDLWGSKKNTWKERLGMAIIIGIIIAIGLALLAAGGLGILWAFWKLWMYVMVNVAAGMPVGFRQPEYEVFLAVYAFAILIRNYIRGFFPKDKTEPE